MTVSVSAKVGDIKGTIYTTDILTKIDGREIASYNIGGETLIVVEDLADYGYTVTYNNDLRALFANRTGDADPSFKPHIERGKVGETAGNIYETDIEVFINGSKTDAYNMGGRMLISAEKGFDDMNSVWIPNERLLCVDEKKKTKKEEVDEYLHIESAPSNPLKWYIKDHIKGDDIDLICGSWGGHHDNTYWTLFRKDGRVFYLSGIFYKYLMVSGWDNGVDEVEGFEIKDDGIYFTGHRKNYNPCKYRMDSETLNIEPLEKETFEDDIYMLDLETVYSFQQKKYC